MRFARHTFHTNFDSIHMTATQLSADVPSSERRSHQGGWLFLGSLLVFFISSLLLYAVYAYNRRDDPLTQLPLPGIFLVSTVLLFLISGLAHAATLAIRSHGKLLVAGLLIACGAIAVGFMAIQFQALDQMLNGPATVQGSGKGLAGMVAVLAFLHALHVAGGVIAIGMVIVGVFRGRYDQDRYWGVDFTAHYWHFLDVVWLCMLLAFWFTTGGFSFAS